MKSFNLKLTFIFLTFSSFIYSQNFDWVQQIGGIETSVGQSIITWKIRIK